MSKKKVEELKNTARRVFIDSSSPSTKSVLRIVLVVFLSIILVTLFGAMLYWLKSLIFLLILSVFFAYILNPLVTLIRKPFKQRNLDKLMPRSLAIVIAYLAVFAVLGILISYLTPKITEQAKQLASQTTVYSDSIQTWFKGVGSRYQNYQIPAELEQDLNLKVREYLTLIGETLTSFAGGLILTIVIYLPWLVLVPIFSFFFLKDVNMIRLSFLRLFPNGNWRARADSFLNDVNTTLAAYTRALIISCFLIGAICTLGFYLLGLNYGLLIGVLAGILEFIPLIGPLTVGIIAVTIAAFASPWQALYIAVFLIVLRIIHDYVTYPRIIREGIHLHPLAIIISVLAGEQIAGITGVFLSIPVVALITVLLKHIREHRGNKGIVAGFLEPDSEIIVGEDITT